MLIFQWWNQSRPSIWPHDLVNLTLILTMFSSLPIEKLRAIIIYKSPPLNLIFHPYKEQSKLNYPISSKILRERNKTPVKSLTYDFKENHSRARDLLGDNYYGDCWREWGNIWVCKSMHACVHEWGGCHHPWMWVGLWNILQTDFWEFPVSYIVN